MISEAIIEYGTVGAFHCSDIYDLKGTCKPEDVHTFECQVDTTESSLSFIGDRFPNLLKLKLNNSTIPNMRDIGCRFTNLRYLSLARCGITSLNGISTISQVLEELYLAFNQIDDCSELVGMDSLIVIDLEENNISDLTNIEFLSTCSNLQSLTLSGNPCVDDPETYRSKVKNLLPKLRYLDERRLQQKETKPNPRSARIKNEITYRTKKVQPKETEAGKISPKEPETENNLIKEPEPAKNSSISPEPEKDMPKDQKSEKKLPKKQSPEKNISKEQKADKNIPKELETKKAQLKPQTKECEPDSSQTKPKVKTQSAVTESDKNQSKGKQAENIQSKQKEKTQSKEHEKAQSRPKIKNQNKVTEPDKNASKQESKKMPKEPEKVQSKKIPPKPSKTDQKKVQIVEPEKVQQTPNQVQIAEPPSPPSEIFKVKEPQYENDDEVIITEMLDDLIEDRPPTARGNYESKFFKDSFELQQRNKTPIALKTKPHVIMPRIPRSKKPRAISSVKKLA